jgi:hypothetical protein
MMVNTELANDSKRMVKLPEPRAAGGLFSRPPHSPANMVCGARGLGHR